MDSNLLKKIIEATEQNKFSYLVTVISTSGETPNRVGARMIVYEDGSIYGTVGGGVLERYVIKKLLKDKPLHPFTIEVSLENGLVKMACGGELKLFVEPLFNPDVLYIIGGGHCGVELSALAPKAGFYTVVADNRKEWASKEKHPLANKIVLTDYKEVSKIIDNKANAYIVIMTQMHNTDIEAAASVLNSRYKYIGMLASKSKAEKTRKALIDIGFDKVKVEAIKSPVGVEIKSDTPFEIAVSILAELIDIRNKGSQD